MRQTPATTSRLAGLLRAYYLATPAFWIADLAFDAPLRVAFLDDLPYRHGYYALCTAIGAVAWLKPGGVPRLALVESGANIALLIVSVMVWYFGMLDWAGGDSALVRVPTPFHLANFLLAAAGAGAGYLLQQRR